MKFNNSKNSQGKLKTVPYYLFLCWLILITFSEAQSNPHYKVTTIGSFTYWQRYDAYSAHTPSGYAGGVYPVGTGDAIYLDGILIGGYQDGELKVSGTVYRNGMVAGYIDESQNWVYPSDNGIFRIRNDYQNMTDEELYNDAFISFEKTGYIDTIHVMGITAIEEYNSDNDTLIDCCMDSHLNPSLSQTGNILDNRAGGINLPAYARDYDRFDYWGYDDVIIDFGDSSLSWEYYNDWLHTDSEGEAVYQPFAVYRIKPFGGDTIRLFAGFWDTNGDGKWSVNFDEADSAYDWVAPTYGAECWEPLYCYQGYDIDGNEINYDPENEADYVAENSLAISANTQWGNSPGEFEYPFVTATLLSAYYGPNEEGSYVEGSPEGGASSLPQAGNYDKYGTQLTSSHYYKFTTMDSSYFLYDSSGLVTDSNLAYILESYAQDWNEWPTDIGAPYYDLNDDGIYSPTDGESPGIAGADQIIWYVATDADPEETQDLYGTLPMNIEMQVTVFVYDEASNPVDNSLFKYVRLINKSNEDITDAYISFWSDPDIGDYTNDLVGVDTTLGMMYAYNGYYDDEVFEYYDLEPPAVGYRLIHGPLVESEGDSGYFNFEKVYDKRNLDLSSFGYFTAGGEWSDPGPYGDQEAAREYYNLMRGFAPTDDLDNPTPWLDSDGNETKFPLAGDPVTNEGQIDLGPSDRRMLMNVGPFTFAAGDTQDVLISIGGGLGSSYINSITELRNNAQASLAYLSNQVGESLSVNTPPPSKYSLQQNYPNPFNPITLISFEIGKENQTTLKVYDLMGKEVATLLNESLAPGQYESVWNASRFASGIYFLKLESGPFTKTHKMILVK